MEDLTGRCPCPNCRTGKCGCRECADGPGIDFRERHSLHDQIMKDVARERVQIRELRAPSIERQKVRRWGDIVTTGVTTDRETIRNETEE